MQDCCRSDTHQKRATHLSVLSSIESLLLFNTRIYNYIIKKTKIAMKIYVPKSNDAISSWWK